MEQHADKAESEEQKSDRTPDLRRFPRFNRSMMVKLFGKPGWHGRTLDISRQGVRIATSRRLAIGETVILELYLSDNDPFPIRLKGECRWSDVSEGNDNVAGIDLSLSHSRSLDILQEYLSQAGDSSEPNNLASEGDRILNEGILVRPERTCDSKAIENVIKLAFENQEHSEQKEAAIVNALRSSGALHLSLVALVEGNIVGHIAFSGITIEKRDMGWFGLGPLAVHPEQQRRGIGQALVQKGLEKLEKLGANGCVVLGDPSFYAKFGFKTKPCLNFPGVAEEYFQALSFDAEFPQGTVVYHQAFYQ